MPKWQCPENARDRGGKKESCGVFRRKSRALMKVSIAPDERRELARVPLKNKNTGDLVLPNYRNRKRTSPLAKRRLRRMSSINTCQMIYVHNLQHVGWKGRRI